MTQLSDALNRERKKRGNWSLRTLEGKMKDAGHNVSFSTIGLYLRGEHGKPEERVLEGFAAVYPDLSITTLRELAGLPAGELGAWKPPEESARLNREQRDALDRLIRTIVQPQVQVDSSYGRDDDAVVDFQHAARTTTTPRRSQARRLQQDGDAEGPQSP